MNRMNILVKKSWVFSGVSLEQWIKTFYLESVWINYTNIHFEKYFYWHHLENILLLLLYLCGIV